MNSDNSITDARELHAKLKTQLKENPDRVSRNQNLTFNQLSKWYLKLPRVMKLKSCWLSVLRIGNFCEEFGDRRVESILKSDIESLQQKSLDKGLAPATADAIIGKTSIMISAAYQDKLVSSDVLRTFRSVKKVMKKGEDVRDRILSPDEYNAFIIHAPDHLAPIFATGYFTGMRRGEIFALTWDNIDLKNRVIKLTSDMTKDNEARKIPIPDELYKILVKLPSRIRDENDCDHVFQYYRKPIKNIQNSLKSACKKAGIVYGRFKEGGFIFHDLRHTFNTNMRKAGVAESVIMSITGHSTRAMFDRYNSIDDDDKKQAVKTLEGYFEIVDRGVYRKQQEVTK